MFKENIAVIISIEVAAILLIICAFLLYQNHSLRRLIKKLQDRMKELVDDLKNTYDKHKQASEEQNSRSFIYYINDELLKTKKYHAKLDSDRDITLDLSPDTALPRRAAALRYAVLLAEKEAILNTPDHEEPPDWLSIGKKYQQIFSFYEDYAPPTEENTENVDALNQELENAKKRIENLTRFKTLYFELEEKWKTSKDEAQHHYNNLSNMMSGIEGGAEIEDTLNSYHNAYNEIETIINRDIGSTTTVVEKVHVRDGQALGELRQLRVVAADQHQLIGELQAKLTATDSQEERTQIITSLENELEKQKRFMQEADTCIQLMEDELDNAQQEVDDLRRRLSKLPDIQNQIHESEKLNEIYKHKVNTLTSENKKLTQQLEQQSMAAKTRQDQVANSVSTSGNDEETSKIKKELQELETRYANLEEKFLDLKMSQ